MGGRIRIDDGALRCDKSEQAVHARVHYGSGSTAPGASGDVGAGLPAPLKENLSPQELSFSTKYNRNLSSYMQAVGVDVSADLHPPKELYIQVRCLQDHGELVTENGTIMLDKDSQHFIRRSDVETL